jgi:signal transduction histidine kinase
VTRPRNPGSIRARVAGGVFLILAVVLGVAGFSLDVLVSEAYAERLDRLLEAEATALLSGSHWEDGEFEFEFDEPSLPRFLEPRRGAYFEVVADGVVAARSKSLDGARIEASPIEAPAEGLAIAFGSSVGPFEPEVRIASIATMRAVERDGRTHAVRPSKARPLIVRVAMSTDDLRRSIAAFRDAALGALPLAALAGALGAFWIAGRATRPLARLTDSARRIASCGEGKLDAGATEGELRELAETLNAACDRVQGAAARERRFASAAAHELRTPLAALRAGLELALSRPRDAAAYRAAAEEALESTLRLQDLSEALLLLHRAEAGDEPTERKDLRDVVRAALDEEAKASGGAAVAADDLGDAPLVVNGRPELLARVVGNLVQNARRHGGGTVLVSARRAGADAVLVVEDDGPGFPEGFAPRAFEPLTRADPSRSRAGGGAGLGLAFVRAVALRHGGTASAENRPEGGARVVVRLPLANP